MEIESEHEEIKEIKRSAEARLKSYDLTTTFQLIMKKKETSSSDKLAPPSRKTSAVLVTDSAGKVPGSLTGEKPNFVVSISSCSRIKSCYTTLSFLIDNKYPCFFPGHWTFQEV